MDDGQQKKIESADGQELRKESGEQNRNIDREQGNLPFFRYHPNPLETGAFSRADPSVICECCGKPVSIYYDGPFYSEENVDYLCPECISSGRAAEKFDGEFQDECSLDDGVEDEEKLDELVCRTPGYCGWQQEHWRAHCGDYCAFMGYVGYRELEQMNIMEEILDDPLWEEEQLKDMENGGSVQGYLFQCLHCGKHLLWVDYD